MKTYPYLTLAALAGSVLAVLTPSARAQSYDAKIKVTFSGPVEVPGAVLPEGSYVFESMDSAHLTRILSADESKVVGTFFTAPDDRGLSADHSVVELGESTNGVPPRIHAWFLPGNSIGDEFLYNQSGK